MEMLDETVETTIQPDGEVETKRYTRLPACSR